jgi:hypothetical protein
MQSLLVVQANVFCSIPVPQVQLAASSPNPSAATKRMAQGYSRKGAAAEADL